MNTMQLIIKVGLYFNVQKTFKIRKRKKHLIIHYNNINIILYDCKQHTTYAYIKDHSALGLFTLYHFFFFIKTVSVAH